MVQIYSNTTYKSQGVRNICLNDETKWQSQKVGQINYHPISCRVRGYHGLSLLSAIIQLYWDCQYIRKGGGGGKEKCRQFNVISNWPVKPLKPPILDRFLETSKLEVDIRCKPSVTLGLWSEVNDHNHSAIKCNMAVYHIYTKVTTCLIVISNKMQHF